MTTEDYLNSRRGMKRIMEIAKAMNRARGISIKQCMELSKNDVAEWYKMFTFGVYEGKENK